MTEVTAIVLAGGRSRRMGQDKASTMLGGRTLLQRAVDAVSNVASEVVVVGAPGRALPLLTCVPPLRVVTDPSEGHGPLAGIVTGLEAATAPVVLVVSCDQPFLRPALLAVLAEEARTHIAVLPLVDDQPQPLCSAVRREALPRLRSEFASGVRRAMTLAELPGALLVPATAWRAVDQDGRSFIGVNTPDELARAESLLREF